MQLSAPRLTADPVIVIPRVCPVKPDGHPEALLFLPTAPPANPGRILCYAHVGQHSEASIDYYRDTRPPRTDAERAACDALVAEYRSIPPIDAPIVVRQRMPVKDQA